jgi:Flp pilus assembly protein TadD
VEAHRALGRAALEARDWPTATTEFGTVLAWNPKDAEAEKAIAAVRVAERRSERGH